LQAGSKTGLLDLSLIQTDKYEEALRQGISRLWAGDDPKAILDDVANGYQGKLQIAKMNVDENRDIPAKFGIRGIPTLMLFKDGQLAATKVGALSKAQLTEFIDQQLA
jgi:thioredoxin-like negative regulator of GroEL